jgi:hypothetical protein
VVNESLSSQLVNLEELSDEDLKNLEKQFQRVRKKESGTETISAILSRMSRADYTSKAKAW